MTYPITERTYFTDTNTAWSFAQMIGNIKHGWIVSDYGVDSDNRIYVETMNDPFSSKEDLMRKVGMLAS